ncbi:MAG: hypothetical protein U0667_09480 [Chloroflexota bacterium]
MTQYSEPDLILPSLALLEEAPDGLTTTQLRELLTEALRPEGHDAELSSHGDSYFTQKVRNLLGVRKTLFVRGWAAYDPDEHLHVITPAGVEYLEQERARLGQVNADMVLRAEDSGTRFGDYRLADEAPQRRPARPFEVDPSELDRASGSHARIQNALSAWIVGRELKPHRWDGGPAQFDIAWFDGTTLFVAEVKSLTEANETRQLRLGLGQVLHYQALLRATVPDVRAVLAVERAPTDRGWEALCAAHGVALVWPGRFDDLAR